MAGKKGVARISTEQHQEIARRYEGGQACVFIAQEMGFVPTTVSNSLKKQGIVLRSLSESCSRRKVDKEQWAEIASLYESGKHPSEIANKIGIHKTAVRYILEQVGVSFRGKGNWQRPLANLSGEQRRDLCRRYIDGEHLLPLAKEFGTNTTGLTTYLRREGVQIRPSQSQINKELIASGEFGKIQSCKIRGIALEDFDGFSKAERQRVMETDAYKKWRFSVFERDSFACQICGCAKGGNLQVHHIRKYSLYPTLRTVTTNGITLCKSCHQDQAGREEDRAPFFEAIIREGCAKV